MGLSIADTLIECSKPKFYIATDRNYELQTTDGSMEIDDISKDELAAIRRAAESRIQTNVNCGNRFSSKSISATTVLKLAATSLGCTIVSFIFAFIGSRPSMMLASLLLSVLFLCISAIFGILAFAYAVATGVYIGNNSK